MKHRQFPMFKSSLISAVLCLFLSSCKTADIAEHQTIAPGAPGADPVWAYAGKSGIGTAYETYTEDGYQDSGDSGHISKVWFSIADGILTETMFGLIHEAQIKDMQLAVVGEGFVDTELQDMDTEISYLHTDENGRPLSPAYRVINTDKEGKYKIEKHIFTDPDRNSLWVRLWFHSYGEAYRPYLLLNPHINNDGVGDRAWVEEGVLYAEDSDTYLSLSSSREFSATSVGFVGLSDGLTDLQDGQLDFQYSSTGAEPGNVFITAELPGIKPESRESLDLVLGFGYSQQDSLQAGQGSLKTGYADVLAQFNGEEERLGWEDYLGSLSNLPDLAAAATDGGALAYASALVLKIQEDKTHAGALIASLSNPWGDTASAIEPATGYKAVWPRDFYQCAMAFLALGDSQTAKVAFKYLEQIQVDENTPGNRGDGGWFLQKTQVNGTLEWSAVQLDQTAMPVMLGWKLWKAGVLSDSEMEHWFQTMLKPAADFLVNGGKIDLDWNQWLLIPPMTQQERWEEQQGYSPSSTAAVITGLVSAADMAEHLGDIDSAALYLASADQFSAQLETTMFTTSGVHNQNGQYYLRITQNMDPNDNGGLIDRNGRGVIFEKDILDGGFLELVRYGVRAAQDAYVLDTLEEFDDMSLPEPVRVKYEFSFDGEPGVYPGWRRYGHDGYGEDKVSGANYGASATIDGGDQDGMSANQRGRVWPFFTGERAHYQLAAGTEVETLRNTYVRAMELFANQGLMLPEQVFDGVGTNPKGRYQMGEGTNSATPLAWTHAEYLKLLRSISDRQVWDRYETVQQRYAP